MLENADLDCIAGCWGRLVSDLLSFKKISCFLVFAVLFSGITTHTTVRRHQAHSVVRLLLMKDWGI
jgi:hypothetical protein